MWSRFLCLVLGHRWRDLIGHNNVPMAEVCERCGLWEHRPYWFFQSEGEAREQCRKDLRGGW